MAVELASRLAASWVAAADPPRWRELEGSAVLVDLSGFTRLAERFAREGPEGPELLHRTVEASFVALLARSIELGGDVIGFAGDAASVWFSADDFDDHLQRAVEAASRLPSDLRAVPAALSGRRRLLVSVGVHTGRFHAYLVDASVAGRDRRAVVWCGPETSLLARLESAAGPGQIAMSDEIARVLPAHHTGPRLAVGRELIGTVRGRVAQAVDAGGAPSTAPSGARVAQWLTSRAVLDLVMSEPLGDHRAASVGFVRIGGLDDALGRGGHAAVHSLLERVIGRVARSCGDHAVEWIDVDVGVDSIKLLLAAGAPHAVDDDEHRLLAVLDDVVSDDELSVTAGAQRGRVFAALLGVRGRASYTLLGDPVNVAARALQQAGAGEIVVADGMQLGVHADADAEFIGDVVVRNRSQPVPLWRVRRVGPRTTRPRAGRGGDVAIVRPREAAELERAWELAVEGVGGVIALVGEPGMGASDLITRLVERAGAAAVAVVADPFRRGVAYDGLRALISVTAKARYGRRLESSEPWIWLATFAERLPERVREWLPDALAVVGVAGAPSGTDPQTSARRARVVLAELLSLVLPDRALVAIDDVDAWDEASRAVLSRLGEISTGRLLVVSRSDGSAGALSGERTIRLGALSDELASQLVLEVAPLKREDDVRRIVDAARGNPLVLIELARRSAAGELPGSLERLGNVLLDSLPVSVRQRVRDVSVFGARVDLDSAADILGDERVADASTWIEAESLVEVDNRTLVFRHEVYRRVASDSLPFRRRRQLHGAIADRGLTEVEVDEAVLALHLGFAGRSAEAAPLAASAARRAKEVGALIEAVDLFDRAIGWMPTGTDDDLMAELWLDVGEVRRWIGDFAAAERCLRSAARRARDPLVRGRACHLLSHLSLHRGNVRAAKSWADRGLSAVEPLGDAGGDVRAHLLLDLAARHDVAGRHARSVEASGVALEWADRHGSRLLVGLAHLQIEMAYSALLDERAIAHGDVAVAVFQELGHDRFLEAAWINTGLTAMYLGRWDDAIDRYRRAIDCADRAGQGFESAAPIHNIGFVLYRRGLLDEAEQHARRALRLVAASGPSLHSSHPRVLLALVAAARRAFDTADRLVVEARADASQLGDESMVVDCDVTTMHCRLLAGRYEEVTALAQAVLPRLAIAEIETAVACERIVGVAESRLGRRGPGVGIDRIRSALATARVHRVLYEVHQGLAALAAAGEAQPAERDELVELQRHLGIVVPPEPS